MTETVLHPIAHMESDFGTKFGIPRQSGMVKELKSRIVFEPEYRQIETLRGIDEFSHLWLIWQFSENVGAEWSLCIHMADSLHCTAETSTTL